MYEYTSMFYINKIMVKELGRNMGRQNVQLHKIELTPDLPLN